MLKGYVYVIVVVCCSVCPLSKWICTKRRFDDSSCAFFSGRIDSRSYFFAVEIVKAVVS